MDLEKLRVVDADDGALDRGRAHGKGVVAGVESRKHGNRALGRGELGQRVVHALLGPLQAGGQRGPQLDFLKPGTYYVVVVSQGAAPVPNSVGPAGTTSTSTFISTTCSTTT